MTDVREQLRVYFDEVDPPFDPSELMQDPRPVLPPRRSGVGRGALVAAAAAAVLVLVVGLPLLFLANRPQTSVEPSPTTSHTVVTTETAAPTTAGLLGPVDELVWSRIQSEELSSAKLPLEGVASGSSRLAAVGWGQPFVWTSPGGSVWSPGPTGDGYEAFDILAWEAGFIAVGGQPGAEVWISEDGTGWYPAPQPGGVFDDSDVVWSVTEGGPGLVAAGEVIDGPAVVWSSADGQTWARVPHDSEVFGLNASIYSVTRGGPGLVAVGDVDASAATSAGCMIDCPDANAAVWTSVDGVEWTRVPHDPSVFGTPEIGTEILDVAVGESGLVAVGGVGDDFLSPGWISTDGLTWTRMPSDPELFDGDESMNSVIATPDGFVAVGQETGRAAAWYSPDGATWTRVPGAERAFGTARNSAMNDIAVGGPGLVAVGWESDPNDRWTAAVWIAEPDT